MAMRSGWIDTRVAGLGLLATLLAAVWGAGSLAWGCVPQPRLLTVQPRSSGPAGTEVTLAALGFDPGRAEIRWNAVDGELLGVANGPEFSVPVTIPRAPEGLYNLIVLARSPGGEIGNTGAVSFQVTSLGATPVAPWSNPDTRAAEKSRSSASSISAGTVLLAAGAGGVASLGCFGGLLLLRRNRTGPAVE